LTLTSHSITTFRSHFSSSNRFREVTALIAATHALSFYSLILQHGVPFQPVSIRVSQDPIGLITKVLEQNPRSYTKVDDLIAIGQNLV
jgi:putative flippase GtrA